MCVKSSEMAPSAFPLQYFPPKKEQESFKFVGIS
jgi:hypothetical protein